MAVYTQLASSDFAQVVEAFDLGTFERAQGIPHGSINTNQWLFTSKGRFFMRHTTVRSAADLTFEARLLAHLGESQFPAPVLILTREGVGFIELAKGRVSVFRYLPGEEMTRARLTADHCENLGRELGKLHVATASLLGTRANPYGAELVRSWLRELATRPEVELQGLAPELEDRLERAVRSGGELLPRGVIHADLFMDNVKWLGERVSAFFDFEMACHAPLTLDLAITLNAWCFEGEYKPVLCAALVRGYQMERKLNEEEKAHLYFQALFGSVRYTASRIRDFHLSTLPADQLARKDFRTYLERGRALDRMGAKGFRSLTAT